MRDEHDFSFTFIFPNQQEALLMALSEKLDQLKATLAQEMDELKATIAAIRAEVEAGNDARDQLAAADAQVDQINADLGQFAEQASAEPTPPGNGGGEENPPA